MLGQLSIGHIVIRAPEGWSGSPDLFHRLLEEAIRRELQGLPMNSEVFATQAVRMDVPAVTVADIYDLQAVAGEVARRIVQAVRQPSEIASESA